LNSFDRDHRRVVAALDALAGPDRDALLAHLSECGECSRALAGVQDALLAALYLPPPRAMDAGRSEEVRSRLLRRAADESAAPAAELRTGVPALLGGGGWVAAAALAALLLTHHSFHRPLQLGWVAASVLGIALAAAGTYMVVELRRSSGLRARVADLEAELARVRAHARSTDRVLGSV